MTIPTVDRYAEGRLDGDRASRRPGGTRGAEWHAEQLGLEGSDREEYIAGFQASHDEYQESED